MKLRTFMGAMGLATLIPVVAFCTLTIVPIVASERDAAVRAVRESASATMGELDGMLRGEAAKLDVLAVSGPVRTERFADLYDEARGADEAGVWTILFDEDGRELFNTRWPNDPRQTPPEVVRRRVAEVIRSGRTEVSNVVLGINSGQWQVMVERPFTLKDGTHRVLSRVIVADRLASLLRRPSTPGTWLIGVFDRNGRTIAKTGRQEGFVGQYPKAELLDALTHAIDAPFRHVSREGADVMTVVDRSPFSHWSIAVGVPVSQVNATSVHAIIFSVTGLIVAVLVALLTAALFSRFLVRAIGFATMDAMTLGRGSPLGPREPSGIDSIDRLSAAQRETAELLHSERLARRTAEAAREELLARERLARAYAEQQNEAKDEFLAMLGHELRNPLAAISNAAAVIERSGAVSNEHQAGLAVVSPVSGIHGVLRRQITHLSRILDDLLDLARVSSGKIVLSCAPLDATALFERVLETMVSSGRLTDHRLDFEGSTAWVNADAARLEQILTNLLDNALKYTPNGGAVHVRVAADGKNVRLSVADTGQGIDEQLLPRVFEAFVQGDQKSHRPQGGLGIGLALVRRLVHLHEGHIEAESDGPGEGSCFTVVLPQIAPVDLPVAPSAVTVAALDVLLIEDHADVRLTMAGMLQGFGCRVATAGSGEEGLALARSRAFAVVFVDLGLPGIDGLTVVRRLRESRQTEDLFIVALSGYGAQADRDRSKVAGVDEHLVKPADMATLAVTLARAQERLATLERDTFNGAAR